MAAKYAEDKSACKDHTLTGSRKPSRNNSENDFSSAVTSIETMMVSRRSSRDEGVATSPQSSQSSGFISRKPSGDIPAIFQNEHSAIVNAIETILRPHTESSQPSLQEFEKSVIRIHGTVNRTVQDMHNKLMESVSVKYAGKDRGKDEVPPTKPRQENVRICPTCMSPFRDSPDSIATQPSPPQSAESQGEGENKIVNHSAIALDLPLYEGFPTVRR